MHALAIPSPSVFQPGQIVGGYELVDRVAAGGMAAVFVARKDGQPFALKVIHEHLSQDWEAMRWFIDEALISIRLRHPNIVRVDELGEQDGLYYLAMEYVHGCSLAELMAAMSRRNRRLDPWLAAWIAARVAEGLHAAHELQDDYGEVLGVIHRDISPQNVLLGHDGKVRLTDFGIAQAKGRAERTRQGEIRGKFRYMAPEQVVGGRDLDRRLDVFSLGVVLWEMLTQRRLHADLTPDAVLDAVKAPEIERPSTIRSDVPPQLEGIVLNALAADRDERPHSAEVLRAELDEAIASRFPDPERALSELLLDLLGPKLLENAQALPSDLAAAIGIEQLEPTIPRARRDDETGKVQIDESLRPTAPRHADASRRVRIQEEEHSSSWAWVIALLLVIAGAAVGAFWLMQD